MRLLPIAAALFAVTALPAFAAEDQASDIAGVWQTKTGGYVQVYRNNKTFVGTIVGSTNGQARYDKKNPDPDKRGRRLLGKNVVSGLKYEGNGEYHDGQIYDPHNGKTYSAKATLKNHDTLDVRGYIGISLLGKTQTWHRIDPKTQYVRQNLLHHMKDATAQSDG